MGFEPIISERYSGNTVCLTNDWWTIIYIDFNFYFKVEILARLNAYLGMIFCHLWGWFSPEPLSVFYIRIQNFNFIVLPTGLEPVISAVKGRRPKPIRRWQHSEQFDMECTAHWFMLWSQQLSLLNGTLSGIVPNHRTLLRFELHQGSLRNASVADLYR